MGLMLDLEKEGLMTGDLEYEKRYWQGTYDYFHREAEKAKKVLDRITYSKCPTNDEFYKNIETYVDITVSEKNYTYILGGDGRSSSWDEERRGIVAEAVVKEGIYLTPNQIGILKNFIENTKKVDHIEIFE